MCEGVCERVCACVYVRLLEELRRVLSPGVCVSACKHVYVCMYGCVTGGTAVVLTTRKRIVNKIVTDDSDWIPRKRLQINLGGLKPIAHIIERSE